MSAFDLLSRLLESASAPTPEGLLAELVSEAQAERGFLSWSGRIWAVDLDGLTLGHGAARVPDRTLRGTADRILRRSEPGSVLAVELATGVGRIGLVLEHRFKRDGFAQVSDEEFRHWVVVAGLAVRWASAAHEGGDPGAVSAEPEPDPIPAESEESRVSVAALAAHSWNISRAARSLGMTRHGLKKRMARLGITRPGQQTLTKT